MCSSDLYTTQPTAGIRAAADLQIIAGANPIALQAQYPTREAADKALEQSFARMTSAYEANDALYYLDASRDYDPSPGLEKITVPVLWVNSADDFINPPELGLAERMVKRMPMARFVLIPASVETRGHGTHTSARFWKTDLAKLLSQ